jgi:hypothetical protein
MLGAPGSGDKVNVIATLERQGLKVGDPLYEKSLEAWRKAYHWMRAVDWGDGMARDPVKFYLEKPHWLVGQVFWR